MRKLLLSSMMFLATLMCFSTNAQAEYPEKPLNMIMAFTAGGSSDVQARIMQKYWNKYVPQEPWVFVYKPGAGGAIGFTEIARAKKDGYTIGGLNVPHIVLQPMAQGAQFKVSDFEIIAQVVNDPQTIAVRNDSPYKNVGELFAAAKKNPKKVKLGLVGPMTGHHLMFLDFQNKYPDFDFAGIFYKGAADQNAALLGGEVDAIFGNLNDVMRSLDEFNILAIASDKRNSFLPKVPTMTEEGYPLNSEIRRFFAVPKGVDAAKVKFLQDAFKQIAEDPDYIADMIKAGQPHGYLNGPEATAWINEQNSKILDLAKESKLIK